MIYLLQVLFALMYKCYMIDYFKTCWVCTSVIWSIISRHVEYVQVLYDRLFQGMLSMYKCCMIDYFKACWVCTCVVWSIISRHVEYVQVLYDWLFKSWLVQSFVLIWKLN